MAKKAGVVVREVEAKFRVNSPFELPPIAGVAQGVAAVDEARRISMTAVYYDTSDLRLAREGVTLRRRSGGSDAGWHLKLPVTDHTVADGTGARDEVQLPDQQEVPPQLGDLVRVWVRTAALGPVATLVTERTELSLRGADGVLLAELVDDCVTVEDASHIHARFREIEIEDAGGGAGAEVIAEVGRLLRDAGAVGGEFVPKVVRALGPRATAPPEPPLPRPVEARDPAHDVIAVALRQYTRQLMAEDVRLRRDLPDAVHQLRVAGRRLRSLLRTFEPLLDPRWARALVDELAWFVGVMGRGRDLEVLRDRLLVAAEGLPSEARPDAVRSSLAEVLRADIEAARAQALAALDGERYLALVDRLVDAACYPRTSDAASRPAGVALPPLLRGSWAKLARRAARVRTPRRSGRFVTDHHRVRIAAKQLRYACDAAALALGEPALRLSRQAERVQEVLGRHQDAVLAAAFVTELAGRPRMGRHGFAFGMLFAMQQAEAAAAREEFASLWPEVARPKLRRFLED